MAKGKVRVTRKADGTMCVTIAPEAMGSEVVRQAIRRGRMSMRQGEASQGMGERRRRRETMRSSEHDEGMA